MVRLRAVLTAVVSLLFADTVSCSDVDTFVPDFADDGRIATLNRSTFISSVLESRTPALVWFYSGSDCPKCEDLVKVIKSAAEKLTAWGMKVGTLDVDGQGKMAREIGLSVPSYALQVYYGSSTKNPYGGLPVRPRNPIASVKDARDLLKQVLSLIPDHVVPVDMTGVGRRRGSDEDVAKEGSALKEAISGGGSKHAVVLVTSSGKSSPFLRVLASELEGKIDAVQARVPKADADDVGDEDKEWVSRVLSRALDVSWGLESFPALFVVDKAAGKTLPYAGDTNDAEEIMAFVRDNTGVLASTASSANASSEAEGSSSKGDDGDDGPEDSIGGVLEVDPERLSTLTEKGVDALVVALVDTEGGEKGIEEIIPGWDAATKVLQGQIRAAVMDCGAYASSEACSGGGGVGKSKPPYIRVYPHAEGLEGGARAHPSVFPASQIGKAVEEAEASLPEVVTVIPPGIGSTRTTEAIQAFIASGIFGEGNPIALFVLSKREEPNLMVKTVANQFYHHGVRTAFISQPDQEVMASLSVTKVPSMMLMFQAPDNAPQSQFHEDGRPVNPSEKAMLTALYSQGQFGPLSHRSVTEFILSHLSRVSMDNFMGAIRSMEDSARLTGESLPDQMEMILKEFRRSEGERGDDESPQGESVPAGKPSAFLGVPEVTAEKWEAMVGGGGDGSTPTRIAGVFFLDRYAEGFEETLKAAEAAAARAVGASADGGASSSGGVSGGSFFWVDVPCQDGFSKALGVSDASDVPVLVAFSPKHEKSSRFLGAWEAESMSSFLGQALGGRAPMFPVDGEIRLGAVDCSQREPPVVGGAMGGGDGEGSGVDEDNMGDLMAEILAEEARAKRELEEAVAKGMEEIREAEEEEGAGESKPKKRTKVVKKKKKKKGSKGGDGEL